MLHTVYDVKRCLILQLTLLPLTPHSGKTEFMPLNRRTFTGPKQDIKLGDHCIKEVSLSECLVVVIDNQQKWDVHLSELIKSFSQKLNLLKSLYFLPRQAKIDFYFKFILPSVTYRLLVWGTCGKTMFSNLESQYVKAAKIICNLNWYTSSKEVLVPAKWRSLYTMFEKRLPGLVLFLNVAENKIKCRKNKQINLGTRESKLALCN